MCLTKNKNEKLEDYFPGLLHKITNFLTGLFTALEIVIVIQDSCEKFHSLTAVVNGILVMMGNFIVNRRIKLV